MRIRNIHIELVGFHLRRWYVVAPEDFVSCICEGADHVYIPLAVPTMVLEQAVQVLELRFDYVVHLRLVMNYYIQKHVV